MINWRTAHLHGAITAGRARRDLGYAQDERVDPDEALRRSGVVVMRRPLDRLAGAYLPTVDQGNAAGVIINANHPPSKQRYTAAHELAHHILHREVAIDLDTEWMARDRRSGTPTERVAEAFAAWFLMPLGLVNSVLTIVGTRGPRFAAEGVYQAALRMGTSFEATAWHLVALRLASVAEAKRLVSIQPASLKQELVRGILDTVGRHDVWQVGPEDRAMAPAVDDLVETELKENLSTGYVWDVVTHTALDLIGQDVVDEPPLSAVGSGHKFRLVFRVRQEDAGELVVRQRQGWLDVVADERVTQLEPQPSPQLGLADPEVILSIEHG